MHWIISELNNECPVLFINKVNLQAKYCHAHVPAPQVMFKLYFMTKIGLDIFLY